jgi:antitoxin component YwqK of YwqJK toxin-antitoxin module
MCYFKNLLNGGYKKYYDNGNLEEDMCFIGGLIHGTRRLYTQEGKLMMTTIHYKGEIKSLKESN